MRRGLSPRCGTFTINATDCPCDMTSGNSRLRQPPELAARKIVKLNPRGGCGFKAGVTVAARTLLVLAVACSFATARVQGQQNPRGTGARPNQTGVESDQQAANAQDQNLRKPEEDKTNSPGAGVRVAPTVITFPDTMVGNTSATKTVTLTIDGAPMTTGAVAINNGEFSVSNSTCTGAVAAHATCAIEIKFTPTQMGAAKGLLTITDSDKSSPQMVTLIGKGTSPASLSPSTTAFDTEVNGATSPKKTITLTNHSDSKLTGMSAGIGGTNAADFALIPESQCAGSLEAHASCTYMVIFTPSEREAETGELSVTDSGGTQTAQLKGNGAGMKISGLLAFGTVTNPETKIQSVTVTNGGAMPIAVGSPTISGSSDASFGIVPYSVGPPVFSTCMNGVVMLNKGQSCTISVRFTPAAGSGQASKATLNIYESDGTRPNTVAISGTN
jgi:Abnormal spindle-like microcephaly-assoc'd, ASPM-SPD-2-Hydin